MVFPRCIAKLCSGGVFYMYFCDLLHVIPTQAGIHKKNEKIPFFQ